MASLIQRVSTILAHQAGEIARLTLELSQALADDAADDEAVRAAQIAAETAAKQAKDAETAAEQLQATLNEKLEEQSAIDELLKPFEEGLATPTEKTSEVD